MSPSLRVFALLWLVVYLPAYTLTYGVLNFVFLCNLGVILTALGLVLGSRLLLSSQAVSAMVVCLVWSVDAGARALLGSHMIGATAYMWDPQYPLATRMLSLYHLGWPVLLVYCLRRTGYDPRGYALQAAIAGVALLASRFAGPVLNANFAFRDPFFGLSFEPPALHLLVIYAALVGVIYLVTHRILQATLPLPPPHSPR